MLPLSGKACGDAVAFKRIPAEERLLAVLADGLGHWVKANILALMTTTMALRFSAEDRDVLKEYIKDNGKEDLVAVIVQKIRGEI